MSDLLLCDKREWIFKERERLLEALGRGQSTYGTLGACGKCGISTRAHTYVDATLDIRLERQYNGVKT